MHSDYPFVRFDVDAKLAEMSRVGARDYIAAESGLCVGALLDEMKTAGVQAKVYRVTIEALPDPEFDPPCIAVQRFKE